MTEYRQLFGPEGEPCGSCGAALAADQRYCLACGARRTDARVPFRDILGDGPVTELLPLGSGYTAMPRAATAGIGPTVNDRLRRNAPLMALVGILLVALLIGVLLGHWAGDAPQVAQAAPQRPQIIQVGAAAPAAATTAEAPTTTEADTPADSGQSSAKESADKAPVKATNSDVKKLQNLSGKDYQKQIDKLGKTISTGGKAPPKDNKAPAGGGDFEDIG